MRAAGSQSLPLRVLIPSDNPHPLQVKALEGHRVVEASCGGTHTVVVTDDGTGVTPAGPGL